MATYIKEIINGVELPVIKKKGHAYVESAERAEINRLKSEAIANGETFYFLNKPCKKGHISKRRVSNGHCLECAKLTKTRNKGKYKKSEKEYYIKNRLKLRVGAYGLTIEQFNDLWNKQNGKCAICFTELFLNGSKTHIDHCKKTGKVRGILCRSCNVSIGHFKHDPKCLRNAALYCEQS